MTRWWNSVERDLWRRAERYRLAALREVPPSASSPFPQPPLETVEKGLGRDKEIPGKPADTR